MKIIIFGGSGAGTTTLAASLAEQLGYTHFDVDDFYWVKTQVPYQIKIARSQRIDNLKRALNAVDNAIVSGSLVSWGEYWSSAFDLAVLLRLPQNVRMNRLKKRELERYGDSLLKDPEMQAKSQEFLEWARNYDDPLFSGRNIGLHLSWAKSLSCKHIEIGDLPNDERMEVVLEKIKELVH
ncbi:AAA family ATPase [Roseivirga sp.]|uniref:AAA family ATPase n=1 Tax=Roseivirga sp. TaxID=1964215 RepID=UPI003B527912